MGKDESTDPSAPPLLDRLSPTAGVAATCTAPANFAYSAPEHIAE